MGMKYMDLRLNSDAGINPVFQISQLDYCSNCKLTHTRLVYSLLTERLSGDILPFLQFL